MLASPIFGDYFTVNKRTGISPAQNLAAYLGGSAIQTILDNPVTSYRQFVVQYSKDGGGKMVDPKIARAEANAIFCAHPLTASLSGVGPRLVGVAFKRVPKFGFLLGYSYLMDDEGKVGLGAATAASILSAPFINPIRMIEKQQRAYFKQTWAEKPIREILNESAAKNYRPLFRGTVPLMGHSLASATTGLVGQPELAKWMTFKMKESSIPGAQNQVLQNLVASTVISPIYTAMTNPLSRLEVIMQTNTIKGKSITVFEACREVTLRGVGGNVIICEEIAAMNMAVFYKVIVPLLQLDNAALIAISTIQSSENFYSNLLDLKGPSGEPYFEQKIFYASCEACRAQGPEVAAECTHLKGRIPHWQSGSRRERIKTIMASNPELYAQEILGISSATNKQAFSNELIDRFMATRMTPYPITSLHDVKHVFVTIDPSGTGASETAIVSGISYHGTFIVLGMESIPTRRPQDYEPILVQHCRRIREIRELKHVQILLIVENNLGLEAAHLGRFVLLNINRVEVLREGGDSPGALPGFHTSQTTKQEMWYATQDMIKQDSLVFSDHFFSIGYNGLKEDPVSRVIKILTDQFRQYAVCVKQAENAFQKEKVVLSGKINAYSQDDLVVTLQLALYWVRYFHHNRGMYKMV